jgi:riboflavin kinase/FMN adenylyltransferase
LGRQLGWPTANLQVDGRKFLPLEGVYAPSAVEVHLLDTERELVGRSLTVEPIALLRRQQRFDGLDQLRAQISRDAEQARRCCGVQLAG